MTTLIHRRVQECREGKNPKTIARVSSSWVVGDALLNLTDAYRIHYEILGNTEPALHTHILPRYAHEPEQFRKHPVWAYHQ